MRPDSAELADHAGSWAGAYVHIPFCARVCPYCDFNVVAGREDLTARFVEAVLHEIELESPWNRLDSVAFGGGTPSRLSPVQLISILNGLRTRFGLADRAEVSIEVNPEDWTRSMADDLVAGGFTRVSFGAQSFDRGVLDHLGRLHSPQQISEGVRSAKAAGFGSISLDLIFGTPGESIASWQESIEKAIALEPDHVSTYALTVERGTTLSRAVRAGAPGPDEDDQADKYELADKLLTAAGFIRYETSNYSRPHHACRYNLLTWAQGEYLAFGPGAHGHLGGVRYRNLHRIEAYLDAIEAHRRPEQGRDVQTAWQREQERLLLGLRRVAGVVAGPAGSALESDDWGRRLFEAGVLARDGARLRVVRPLLGDEAGRAVLALAPADC